MLGESDLKGRRELDPAAADEHDGADARAGRRRVELVLGSSGSVRIRSAIVQVLVRRSTAALPLQEAIELPRIHPTATSSSARAGSPEVLDELEAAACRWCAGASGAPTSAAPRPWPQADGLVAAGDPRRGGAGLVVSA